MAIVESLVTGEVSGLRIAGEDRAERGHLAVELVEGVDDERLESLRLLGTAVLELAMVRGDEVEEMHLQIARESFDPCGALVDELAGDHDMADQPPFVGIGETLALAGQLPHLSEVVEEAARGDQVAIELRIVIADPPGELEDGEGVLTKSARPGVVDGLRGGRDAEGGPQLGVVEEPEQKLSEVPVANLGAEAADLRESMVSIHALVL